MCGRVWSCGRLWCVVVCSRVVVFGMRRCGGVAVWWCGGVVVSCVVCGLWFGGVWCGGEGSGIVCGDDSSGARVVKLSQEARNGWCWEQTCSVLVSVACDVSCSVNKLLVDRPGCSTVGKNCQRRPEERANGQTDARSRSDGWASRSARSTRPLSADCRAQQSLCS